jgi:hypothetical protein
MDEFKSLFHETAPAEGGGFKLIEQGEYEAELTEAKLDLEREPAQISLVYQITQEPYVGRKLFSNYNLSGQGIGYLKKDLDLMGLNYADVGSPEDIVTLLWDNLPMQAIIFVNQKAASNGKVYNNTYLNEVVDRPAHHEVKTPPKQAAKPPPAPPTTGKPKNHAPQKTVPPKAQPSAGIYRRRRNTFLSLANREQRTG